MTNSLSCPNKKNWGSYQAGNGWRIGYCNLWAYPTQDDARNRDATYPRPTTSPWGSPKFVQDIHHALARLEHGSGVDRQRAEAELEKQQQRFSPNFEVQQRKGTKSTERPKWK